MLYPQSNQFRQLIGFPEFWDFRFDLPWGWDERQVCVRFGSVNTRDRRPKLAAHQLRESWNQEKGGDNG